MKDSVDTGEVEKEILGLLGSEADLRSKRELIEKFIQENLPEIKDSEEVNESFEKFWSEQKQRAFEQIIKDENLSAEKTQTLIEDYLYAEREPLRDEVLRLLEGEQPKILERKKTGDRILKKIVGFVETFINGMAGA
jgi:type I restriction enzyme R subunit